MYNIKDKFFYEVLEDYRAGNNKKDIFKTFCNELWNSDNIQKLYTSSITFYIDANVPDEYREVFSKYNDIKYMNYRRKTTEMDYISLIRQKINNIYSVYCDKRIYLSKEYRNCIMYPKDLYFKYINSNTNSKTLTPKRIDEDIQESLIKAEDIKNRNILKKIPLVWDEYQCLMEDFLLKCFISHKSIEEQENKDVFVLNTDLWIEDNYYISYFCKSIEGRFKNYIKDFYGVKRGVDYKECVKCGGLIEVENKSNICIHCKKYRKSITKVIKCKDCGVDFMAKAMANNKVRCDACQQKHTRENKTLKQREYRLLE